MSDLAFELCRALSMAAFFAFGWACLSTRAMVLEFERYGLARLRKLTGVLELAGALGLLVGYFNMPILILASGGLSLLMLMGVLTRLRIRDSLVQMLPALALLVMNAYVCAFALGQGRG